ncbi:helix-turn-helix transcriptional regulator [Pseudomonas viridiflava]|uniref:Helix-turn-helix domain-containing protein n=1 Tax=Pseudomonas petroselini TaxID=2899822 RepID=A0ABS8QZW8_9PSED|nr:MULTISPECIES: helix-turn-helix transcriptional regulator [Pseudomonas]MEE3913470.1 helix-turn-helix transcriptional regulator [Pseudomonas viridiflava]MCD7040958.1 helix-turn-helix domain-containing protein [Pseudomonas petroselini]MCD7044853.1 helix-turn-helix domain-containing protein [Pseudomonas petroselini]MCD7069606.1 helix-turn-helix domain-containing protein [Pseudomonas petroselini]MCD7080728.1 helix-turn-helix domain-containing protein [Pseudomonas petroselini]
MSLRKSYAAVVQLLRTRKGLSQAKLAGSLTQAHVSELELGRSSATIEMSARLASALKVEPITLLALAAASHEKCTVREALLAALAEAESLGLADTPLPTEPQVMAPSRVLEAKRKWLAVQELKAKGLSQSEAAKHLGVPESTLRRLWHQTLKD